SLFEIKPDFDLNIMTPNQTLEDITVAVLTKTAEIIRAEKPDYIIVQGDTTTGMAASLAAFYNQVKIIHVEAGLRTYDIHNPYPEEVNRVIIDAMTDIYCAHTSNAKENLIKEGVRENKIVITGNTVIDALLDVSSKDVNLSQTNLRDIPLNKRIILVTSHRKESLGAPLENICAALKSLAEKYKDTIHIVFPVHLNPNVQKIVFSTLDKVNNISLIEPLDYLLFVQLLKQSYLILSDSGGIQEEAPSLNKPVLVLRDTTERPEAAQAGATKIIGTDTQRIIDETSNLLDNEEAYNQMTQSDNPYGDGTAAMKIVTTILARNN
ncbi:MAG: UDP-N-acetylglucosamine 2-epimerase (non-hydrolyzing), partial [Candidatus Omnitrophota bacterium]